MRSSLYSLPLAFLLAASLVITGCGAEPGDVEVIVNGTRFAPGSEVAVAVRNHSWFEIHYDRCAPVLEQLASDGRWLFAECNDLGVTCLHDERKVIPGGGEVTVTGLIPDECTDGTYRFVVPVGHHNVLVHGSQFDMASSDHVAD